MIKNYLILMRFHKPIGMLLLLWPTLWALWLANHGLPTLRLLIVFIIGVVVMRAAGCIANDLSDRKIDGHVARTQNRPLASGCISAKGALIALFILGIIALLDVLFLNWLSFYYAIAGALLTCFYPLCKRFFPMPQLVLGVTFNLGVLIAFAATQNHVPPIAWVLYASTLCWTIAYDTAYAMVDREDDLKMQLKSSAILFGVYDRLAIAVFQCLMLGGLIWAGFLSQLSVWFWVSLFVAALLMSYQQYLIRGHDRDACFKAFLNNNWVGIIVLLGIVFSYGLLLH